MAHWAELKNKSAVDGLLTFHLDEGELQRLVRDMEKFPAALEQSALAAADATQRVLRRHIVKGVTAISTLPAAYVRCAVKGYPARFSGNEVTAEVRVASARLPLIRYKTWPERAPNLAGVPVRSRRRLSYQLQRSGGRLGDHPVDTPDAAGRLFVQNMKSGHTGVFYRKKGGGIAQQYAPSVQFHLYADGFMEQTHELMRTTFIGAFKAEAKLLRGVS